MIQTPKALWRRIREDGAEDLKRILKRWPTEGFFIPPKNEQVWQTPPQLPMMSASALQAVPAGSCHKMLVQAKQQGGTLVFDGRRCLWRYDDPATSAHARPTQILEEGLRGIQEEVKA